MSESKPEQRGTYYGELSAGGGWKWVGTGKATDTWVMNEAKEQKQAKLTPEPLAITPGTAVPGSTTIDALFTSLFATRSGDLGAATYSWNTPNSIVATFAAGTTPSAALGSAMFCRFEARPVFPSSIKQ